MDAFALACAMLAALREGQIPATALVAFCLARIARYNQELNVMVIPNYEQARRRAAEADAARRLGESFGPLHGLPIRLQAIGPYLEDRTPIIFAVLLAQALGGFVPPPGYDA